MESFIIVLLVIASIVSVAFIIERAIALRWSKTVPAEVREAVRRCESAKDLPALRKTCEINPSPLARLIMVAISHIDCPKNETIDALQTRARHEVAQMERGLVVLEITTGIAPLLGLVGTIFGLILLFNAMGAETNNQGAFAAGIALALRATLMGLLVAIPSLIFWSYYNRRVETLTVEMETICDEFLQRFYRTQNQR
jgi:biopolymer transport protein ExbB